MADITTVFDTQIADKIDTGSIISGLVSITDGTTGGDVWDTIQNKFQKVLGVLFSDSSVSYDRDSKKIIVSGSPPPDVSNVFFIARGIS